MSNDLMSKKNYDLEERIAVFGENIIKFAKKIPQNTVNNSLITQLVKAGTSVVQIIVKLMMPNQKKILNTKFVFAKKRLEKQNIG